MRLRYVLCVIVCLGAGYVAGAERGLINTSASPHVKLQSVDIDAVRWTDGFWAERFDWCRKVVIPSMWRLLDDPEISHAYENFLVGAGVKQGTHRGPKRHDGASPDGSKAHSSIQLVHQTYGRAHQLPNVTAYNESCATVGFVLWNWRMLATTAQARFAGLLELALYNGVLATISLDGKEFFYANPLRRVAPDRRGYAIRAALVTQTATVYKLLLPRGHQRSAWRGQRSSWLSHKLLGAVTVLEGKARVLCSASLRSASQSRLADGSWNNTLFREIPAQEAKIVDVRLIPYYAWGNRGDSDLSDESEMTVWIPLR